jgi:hypothetical protein
MIYFGYTSYLLGAIFLVAVVGRKLYQDGGIWLLALFDGNDLANKLNNMLLLGYILVNLGFAFYTMTAWDHSISPILESLRKTGFNMLILGYLHFQNVIGIYLFNHFKILKKWTL